MQSAPTFIQSIENGVRSHIEEACEEAEAASPAGCDLFILAGFLAALVAFEAERHGVHIAEPVTRERAWELLADPQPESVESLALELLQLAGAASEAGRPLNPRARPAPRLYPDAVAATILRERDSNWNVTQERHQVYRFLSHPRTALTPESLLAGEPRGDGFSWREISKSEFVLLDRALLGTPSSFERPTKLVLADSEYSAKLLSLLDLRATRFFSNGAHPSAPFEHPGCFVGAGVVCDAIAIVAIDERRLAIHERMWNCMAD